jgi:bacterioferritin (cytochrome b1)
LNRLLRCELTAVNQQFIHVLALRDWGYTDTAERIMKVDYVDFPNAMRIIDYLVESGLPVLLPSECPAIGTSYQSILRAERAHEQRLSTVIEQAVCTDVQARALVSAARSPRQAYAAWLADRPGRRRVDRKPGDDPFPESLGVFAHLIVMIEQALVHAFVLRHACEAGFADAAWATSGAAMMQASEFVHLFAAHGSLPRPREMPALRIAGETTAALDHDRRLAEDCARQAAEAAHACSDRTLARLCRKIARYALQLSGWRIGEAHPARGDIPAGFSRFERTLRKFVHTTA